MRLDCSKCKENLPVEKFSKATTKKRGYSHLCKDCHNKYVRETWYVKNQQKQIASSNNWKKNNKAAVLAVKYNASKELIEDLLEYGKCQVCDSTENLCIDHCHLTQKVRGILCKDCNFALGFLKDSVDRLRSAMLYLESNAG